MKRLQQNLWGTLDAVPVVKFVPSVLFMLVWSQIKNASVNFIPATYQCIGVMPMSLSGLDIEKHKFEDTFQSSPKIRAAAQRVVKELFGTEPYVAVHWRFEESKCRYGGSCGDEFFSKCILALFKSKHFIMPWFACNLMKTPSVHKLGCLLRSCVGFIRFFLAGIFKIIPICFISLHWIGADPSWTCLRTRARYGCISYAEHNSYVVADTLESICPKTVHAPRISTWRLSLRSERRMWLVR